MPCEGRSGSRMWWVGDRVGVTRSHSRDEEQAPWMRRMVLLPVGLSEVYAREFGGVGDEGVGGHLSIFIFACGWGERKRRDLLRKGV